MALFVFLVGVVGFSLSFFFNLHSLERKRKFVEYGKYIERFKKLSFCSYTLPNHRKPWKWFTRFLWNRLPSLGKIMKEGVSLVSCKALATRICAINILCSTCSPTQVPPLTLSSKESFKVIPFPLISFKFTLFLTSVFLEDFEKQFTTILDRYKGTPRDLGGLR